MHFLTFLTTLLLAATPIVAITEAKDRANGDCALGQLNLDATGQAVSCGNGVIPIGFTGDYKGLDGKL